MNKTWRALAQILTVQTLGLFPRALKTSRRISDSEVFMYEYYRLQLHPAVVFFLRSKNSLIRHYVVSGAKVGLNPHHLFETAWYLRKNKDVAERKINPLDHYLKYGYREKRRPSPFLEVEWFFAKMGVPDAIINPLMFYRLTRKGGSVQPPTPFFDPVWYQKNGPDLDPTSDLFGHFMNYGRHEKRNPNRYFDAVWYISRYSDVAQSGQGPSSHFLLYGSDEDRDPSLLFSTSYYRKAYNDASSVPIAPLVHFIAHGRSEGRQPYDADALPPGARIAVIVHLYHKDIWREIARHLGNLPRPFDLFVSVPASDASLAAFMRLRYPNATIIQVDNYGHDIAPFFEFLSKILDSGVTYTAICKVHTKRGTTHPTLWRRLLLQSTLRNKPLVSDIVRLFMANESLYMAGGSDLYISGWEFIGANGRQVADMCADLYPGRSLPPAWGFFAGTMFWFRPEVLRRLTALVAQKRDSFGENVHDNDGQFSHALERMMGYLATLEQKQIALVRSTGDGPRDFTVDCVSAHTSATTEQPHYMLDRIARQHPYLEAEGSVEQRRVWRPDHDAELGVHFVGPLTFINGLGTSCRNYMSTMLDLPINVSAERWSWGFDRLQECAYALPPKSDQPIRIVHLNLDLLYSVSVNHPPLFADLFVPNRYCVLICYFELVSLMPEWIPILQKFDEVWCASTFMARAISAGSDVLARVVRPPLTLIKEHRVEVNRCRFGLPEDRYVFGYFLDAGSVIGRKNPEALLHAYCDEFDPEEGACCFLKIHYGDPAALLSEEIQLKISGRRDVILSNAIYPAADLPALFEAIDCYVSPHRSEGLGLTMIEAMNAGKPTIATPYGGAADFITDETAFKLDFGFVEVGDGNSPYPANYIWAEPDLASLSSTMRHVFEHKDVARDKGQAGQRFVRGIFGERETRDGMRAALDTIWRARVRPRLST